MKIRTVFRDPVTRILYTGWIEAPPKRLQKKLARPDDPFLPFCLDGPDVSLVKDSHGNSDTKPTE